MPQSNFTLYSIIAIAFSSVVGFFTAVLGYHTKNNYVKKEDFKEHCKEMRITCSDRMCKKIDEIKNGQNIVFNKLDLITRDVSNLKSQISSIESSFLQYKEDKRNGIKKL